MVLLFDCKPNLFMDQSHCIHSLFNVKLSKFYGVSFLCQKKDFQPSRICSIATFVLKNYYPILIMYLSKMIKGKKIGRMRSAVQVFSLKLNLEAKVGRRKCSHA